MNYSNTHFCITCGAQILDDPSANECAICRGNFAFDDVSEPDRKQPQVTTNLDNPSKERSHSTRDTWVLVWFVIGLVWYLFDLSELSTERNGWLLYVEALRPVSYGELGIKTLGVIVAGPMVVGRFVPAVTSFLSSLIKSLAIGAAIFIGIAIVVNPSVWSGIEDVGTELVDRFIGSSVAEVPDISSVDDVARVEPTIAIEPQNFKSVNELRERMLEWINADRAKNGVAPVVLGSNSAAQDKANEMLTFGYLGHWWTDGKKPYMAYSQAGGTSYVVENVAVAGHKIAGFINNDCSSVFSLCEKLIPDKELENLQYRMVYDDAESDWGHRTAILDPAAVEVSIGIAFDDNFISLAQHFSGGAARVLEGPTIADARLSMKIEIFDTSIDVFEAIAIWWEPLPTPRDPEAISALRSYCVGGDFTAECGDPLFSIIPPAPSGMFYTGLTGDQIVADEWTLESGFFEFSATLPETVMKAGVYTVGVFADEGGDYSGQTLVQLSTRYVE